MLKALTKYIPITPCKVEENGKTIGNDTLENKMHVISNVKDHKQTSKMCGIKI
jgi:hypothetical protein